jgi:hypothetical protein
MNSVDNASLLSSQQRCEHTIHLILFEVNVSISLTSECTDDEKDVNWCLVNFQLAADE